MSDDVTYDMKSALKWLRSLWVPGWPASGHVDTLLAHIDSEPARTKAAVERAREEQREACARHICTEFEADLDIDADDACRNTPLTATPLADELERSWQETARMVERAEKLERERDEALSALNLAEVARKDATDRMIDQAAQAGRLLRELESRYGVELLARALAESEPLVSGYVRLHGRVWHLSEIHRLAQAAVAVLQEGA